MIQVKNISFGHAGDFLYQDASFSVPKGKKVGLVGLNGSGKSTLFNLILRKEWPDEGIIRVEGSVLLVPQEVSADPIQQAADNVRTYLAGAKKQSDSVYRQLLSNMELSEVSLDDNPDMLSGGQKTKLAILFAVLSEPDILLLDEPTNFLDTSGKKWVMHWLAQYKKTLVVVSHDLDLLDRAISKVVYINKQTRRFEEYTGTYSQFKRLKADHDRHLERYIKNQEQRIARMEKSVERLKKSTHIKVIHQRILLEKRLQKIKDVLPQMPKEIVRIKLQLPTPSRCGELPLRVSNLSKRFGEKQVLRDVSFSLRRGERYALIGHNGAGKSTLITIIMNKIAADSGQAIIDDQVQIGYYSQEFEAFDLEQTVFDTILTNTLATEGQARAFLARFMFRGEALRQQVKSLSGGEKTRLFIALLMLKNYNLLILDEPTTYLDVLSQRIILEALKEYTGTMLVVSHTPEFLKELKPHKALLLPEETFVYWDDALLDKASVM